MGDRQFGEHVRLDGNGCHVLETFRHTNHTALIVELHDDKFCHEFTGGEDVLECRVDDTTSPKVVLKPDMKLLSCALTIQNTDEAFVDTAGTDDSFEAGKTGSVRGMESGNHGRNIDLDGRPAKGGEMQSLEVSQGALRNNESSAEQIFNRYLRFSRYRKHDRFRSLA